MKIAITGKGGAGKTTIAATLARCFARQGFHVMAVDGDPSPNLATALGVSAQAREQLRPLPQDLLAPVTDSVGAVSMTLTRTREQIESECAVIAPDGVALLMGSHLEVAGKGCLCSKHATVKGLMGEMPLDAADVMLLDMEASIEHLSRGTIAHAETLLIVLEPYYRALETAGRIAALAPQLGIPTVMAIGNKLRTPDDAEIIRTYCGQHDIDLGALVPFDEGVGEADRRGVALIDHAPYGPASLAIGQLASRLVALPSLSPT